MTLINSKPFIRFHNLHIYLFVLLCVCSVVFIFFLDALGRLTSCRVLHKVPKFHPVSWGRNRVETHSFRMIRSELCGSCKFPQTFHTRKLGEISVFYAALRHVLAKKNFFPIICNKTHLQCFNIDEGKKINCFPKEVLLLMPERGANSIASVAKNKGAVTLFFYLLFFYSSFHWHSVEIIAKLNK